MNGKKSWSLSPNEVPTSVLVPRSYVTTSFLVRASLLVPRSYVTTSFSKSIRDSQRSEGEARTKVVIRIRRMLIKSSLKR